MFGQCPQAGRRRAQGLVAAAGKRSPGILISLAGCASLAGERFPTQGVKRVVQDVPAYGLAAEPLVSDLPCTFAA